MRLIDADLLIEWIDAGHLRNPNELCFSEADVVEMIDHMPTIEERKKGKWIVYKAPDKYHCGLVKCPFCGDDMIAEADEYNYCPNCGADMIGGQE